jgi:hypothetical protein
MTRRMKRVSTAGRLPGRRATMPGQLTVHRPAPAWTGASRCTLVYGALDRRMPYPASARNHAAKALSNTSNNAHGCRHARPAPG